MNLYDRIFTTTQEELAKHAKAEEFDIPDSTKVAITIRIPNRVLVMVDHLGETFEVSRNSLINEMIYDGTQNVIKAYSDAHGSESSEKVKQDIMEGYQLRMEAEK